MNSKFAFSQGTPLDFVNLYVGGYLPWQVGTCLVPTPVENFTADAFFKDHWYVQSYLGDFEWILPGICPTAEYKVTKVGEILQLDYHYVKVLGKYLTVRANSFTDFIKEGKGHLPVTYGLIGGAQRLEVGTYVLGTDYKNWAVVYYCRQQTILKMGKKQKLIYLPIVKIQPPKNARKKIEVLTRLRNGTDQTKPILDTLKKNNLNFHDFTQAVNTGCAPDEPHL
uniref:Lipocalin/cytosolic fatty-acid binding domain-containing protein n=1 Tax=Rhodnius prolixus TaxID=13249 RepID=T1IGK7_RHOPR